MKASKQLNMKEEKDSIFPFRRRSTNRLSLHLDRKKEKKEDGQVKRASWSSFPLLRFSSSSSTSSSSSSSPMAQNRRSGIRKCNSSEEIKHLSIRNSPPKVNFQAGSNASIRSSVSTSSTSSTSSGVRTGGSSSITSILEGSGSDAISCDSYGGTAGEFHHYPVNRTASEVIHPKRHDSSYGQGTRGGGDECISLPSLGPGGGKGTTGPTSPRILYAHRKTPDVKQRSRKQLELELEAFRRTGSLPGGLEAQGERAFDAGFKTSTPADEKAKPKHKKSFSFIHNSKFLGRLESRTKREGKSPSDIEADMDYGVGQGDKQTGTSSPQPSVSLQHQDSPPAHLRLHHQHSTPSRLSPASPSPPPPLPRLAASPKSSPASRSRQSHHYAVGLPHSPSSPPQYTQRSQSPKALHRSPAQAPLSPPRDQYAYHNKDSVTAIPTPKPPPPPYFQPTDGLASSPPQFSLAAFLDYAFGNGERGGADQTAATSTSPQPPPPPPPPKPTQTEHHDNSPFLEAFNPRYLETHFDSPLDFVTERNYANLRPEIRDIRHQVLFKGKEPCLPLSRSEYGDLELKQSFLGVISDTIEEEEEEGAESECEIGELLCQVDSTCFERSMEDKLEEMAGRVEEEGDAEESAATRETVKEGHVKGRAIKKPNLKLQLMKPENDMVKRVQRSRLLRHISEEAEVVNSGGEEEVEEEEVQLRTPSTPRSPAIDIDNVFEQKQREIAEDKDDMSRLRDLTTRLQLTTRRPSYLDWAAVLKERGRRVGEALAAHTPTVVESGVVGWDGKEEQLQEEKEEEEEELSLDKRKHNLQTAVDWVRKELMDMRQQDQQLARQLLQLRVEVQRLRLLHSCLATSCLLEEVASGAQEARMMEASDLCDLPPDLRETFSPVLREMGLTRMNITSRRFSLR